MYGREEASWEEIRQIYERGVEPLAAFFDAARRAVQSREEGAAEGRKAIDRYLELLWNLLEANQAVSAIETWIDDALQRDERLVAEEHFQVYQGVVGLIEQLSHVLGDVEATPSEFAEIVTAGLKRLRIGGSLRASIKWSSARSSGPANPTSPWPSSSAPTKAAFRRSPARTSSFWTKREGCSRVSDCDSVPTAGLSSCMRSISFTLPSRGRPAGSSSPTAARTKTAGR